MLTFTSTSNLHFSRQNTSHAVGAEAAQGASSGEWWRWNPGHPRAVEEALCTLHARGGVRSEIRGVDIWSIVSHPQPLISSLFFLFPHTSFKNTGTYFNSSDSFFCKYLISIFLSYPFIFELAYFSLPFTYSPSW